MLKIEGASETFTVFFDRLLLLTDRIGTNFVQKITGTFELLLQDKRIMSFCKLKKISIRFQVFKNGVFNGLFLKHLPEK